MIGSFSPENGRLIQYELEVGTYGSRNELLDDTVCLLKRRRDLKRDVRAGIDSGPSIPASEVFGRFDKKQAVEQA
jgi:hypothetical protein